MSKLALKCVSNEAIFKQIYTLKLLIAFEMAYSCCFSSGGNLDFLESLQIKFYNINTRWRKSLRMPWSSGWLGRRIIISRSWVQILALDTGWTFFTLICRKFVLFDWEDRKEMKKRPRLALLKKPSLPHWIKNIFSQ